MKRAFSITRFVTLNIVSDWMNSLKDVLGMEQRSYNEIVNNTAENILSELENIGDILWFRQTVDRTFESTLQVTIYGQLEVKDEDN